MSSLLGIYITRTGWKLNINNNGFISAYKIKLTVFDDIPVIDFNSKPIL